MNTYLVTSDKSGMLNSILKNNFTSYCSLFDNVTCIRSNKTIGTIRDVFKSNKIKCAIFVLSDEDIRTGWATYDIPEIQAEWLKENITLD